MPNSHSFRAAMRKIAADAVDKVFPYLPGDWEDALVTSVMRQWATYDNHAVLMAPEESCYLLFSRRKNGYDLTINRVPGDSLQPFCRDWQIDLEQIPEIVQQLNICQSAPVRSRQGKSLRFAVDPKERTLRIEELSESL